MKRNDSVAAANQHFLKKPEMYTASGRSIMRSMSRRVVLFFSASTDQQHATCDLTRAHP